MMLRITILGLILALAATDELFARSDASASGPTVQGISIAGPSGVTVSPTSVEVRWNGPGSRSQVTFTPAPELPYVLGIAGTMGVAFLTLTCRRLG